MSARKPYPSDVSDDERTLVALYLTLLADDAGQREHNLREAFNGLRYVLKTGALWRWMLNDLPPWAAVYQQSQRWLAAGCFEALADDLRAVLRFGPESGQRAGYDGAKRKRGSKLHLAVDTLGHLLALHVTKANADDRAEVGRFAEAIQDATGDSVSLAYVDQGYTGDRAAEVAKAHGIELEVIKLPEAKKGFVLLPRRWAEQPKVPRA